MTFPDISLRMQPQDANLVLGFKYSDAEMGKRSKIGGTPEWIQDPEQVKCKVCNQPMSFYAQIDSINDEYVIGDCGMVYVFLCLDCLEAKAVVQTY